MAKENFEHGGWRYVFDGNQEYQSIKKCSQCKIWIGMCFQSLFHLNKFFENDYKEKLCQIISNEGKKISWK